MTTILDEVAGARERPGSCRVQITREENGSVVLSFPPAGVSPPIWFFSAVMLGNLLITLYTGTVLLILHRSVLFMTQISPGGLPLSLNHYDLWLWLALLLAVGLGFWTLAIILRPVTSRERLEIGPLWVTIEHRAWGRTTVRQLARQDVRGFLLRRVPPGLDSGILTVQGRGEEIVFGEYLREADREWLVSVGNALLK